MQKMTAELGARGLNVMAFPCNQFGAQEPGTEAEVKEFATKKFGVTFPMFSKIKVNGDGTHPVYAFLKTCFPGDVTWNFASKFLVNQDGVPVARFEKESWEEIEATVKSLLDQGADAAAAVEEKTAE
jgi:glutathione peroxidase